MTPAAWEALSPRERDAAVEAVYGSSSFQCPNCDGTWFGTRNWSDENSHRYCKGPPEGCGWEGPVADAPPPYTTSIATAWGLVEEMEEAGWHWASLHYTTTQKGPTFRFWKPGTDGVAFMAETLPEAVCLAYLEAKGA